MRRESDFQRIRAGWNSGNVNRVRVDDIFVDCDLAVFILYDLSVVVLERDRHGSPIRGVADPGESDTEIQFSSGSGGGHMRDRQAGSHMADPAMKGDVDLRNVLEVHLHAAAGSMQMHLQLPVERA